MKAKKILMSVMSAMLILSTANTVYAGEMNKKEERHHDMHNHVKVMGEVKDVKKIDDKTTYVTVDGYVNGDEIIKEEIVLVVTDETKVASSKIIEKFRELHEKYKGDKEGFKKAALELKNSEKVTIEKGDYVMAAISDVMTKSIPPQSVARFIKVTKPKK